MSKKVTRGSKISMHLWFIGIFLVANIFIFDFDFNTIKDMVLEIEIIIASLYCLFCGNFLEKSHIVENYYKIDIDD